MFEIVLHADEEKAESIYLPKFKAYLVRFNINATFAKRFYAGGLCFLEVQAPSDSIAKIAEFSLVRVVREMPALRMLRPVFRSAGMKGNNVVLPNEEPINKNVKVAIFDGGIPTDHPITKWARPIDATGVGQSYPSLLEHGVGVTSAFLFGHLEPNKPVNRPYSYVDHYRVLDIEPGQNQFELYEVLGRIDNVLKTQKYDFINLSLGPRLPIDDDDVHAWTAVIDEHLAAGHALAVIAVGNDGEGDPAINANRVQVPADCVNALGVGACDVPDDNWQRAPYSSIGPGRSPGLIKPDIVEFGGSVQRPFLVIDSARGVEAVPTGGTSFAAPSTLRMGVGINAHFGSSLNSLAIRTLLIHTSENPDLPSYEIGWGRIARSLNDIVICNDNVVRVVYQGWISASKYVRAPIPLPDGPLSGRIKIKATLCYATAVDPHHPNNYTRSGLEVTFRPDRNKRTTPSTLHASSKPFFGKARKGLSEAELRRDAWKWENSIHAENRFLAKTLFEPSFDIHYNSRFEGHSDSTSQSLQYALVVTVESSHMKDLYNEVVRKYASQLEIIQPIIDIPVRV